MLCAWQFAIAECPLALAISDVEDQAGEGFCGACRGRGAVGPRADEPGPYLPHGAAPGAPRALKQLARNDLGVCMKLNL